MESGFCSHLLFFLEVYLNTEKCTDPVYSWVGFHVHMYVQCYSRSRPRHMQCPGKLSPPHLVTTHLPPLASDHEAGLVVCASYIPGVTQCVSFCICCFHSAGCLCELSMLLL